AAPRDDQLCFNRRSPEQHAAEGPNWVFDAHRDLRWRQARPASTIPPLATSSHGSGMESSAPVPAMSSRRGNRPRATAPRYRGKGYFPSGARTRTAESGMGEKITTTVVQNGARRNAAMLQRELAARQRRGPGARGRPVHQPVVDRFG